jgi:hypothetical protein
MVASRVRRRGTASATALGCAVIVAATAVGPARAAPQLAQATRPAAAGTTSLVRDRVVIDQLVGVPQVTPSLSFVDEATRSFRLDLLRTGVVSLRAPVAALDDTGRDAPVAAKGSNVLVIDHFGHLVRYSTSGRLLTRWPATYVAVDADLSTARRTVAALLIAAAPPAVASRVTLVRGVLGTKVLRKVRSWPSPVSSVNGPASLAMAPDGASAYVALRTWSGTAIFRVNLSTGAQQVVRIFSLRRAESIDVSPDGRWLALTWTATKERSTQYVSLVPTSGRGGLYARPVPGAVRAGEAGTGPTHVAFSADGRRLFISYPWSYEITGLEGDQVFWAPGALLQLAVAPVGGTYPVDTTHIAGNGLAVLRP